LGQTITVDDGLDIIEAQHPKSAPRTQVSKPPAPSDTQRFEQQAQKVPSNAVIRGVDLGRKNFATVADQEKLAAYADPERAEKPACWSTATFYDRIGVFRNRRKLDAELRKAREDADFKAAEEAVSQHTLRTSRLDYVLKALWVRSRSFAKLHAVYGSVKSMVPAQAVTRWVSNHPFLVMDRLGHASAARSDFDGIRGKAAKLWPDASSGPVASFDDGAPPPGGRASSWTSSESCSSPGKL